MLDARRTQEAVDLRGADPQKFFLKSSGQRRAAPLLVFQPFRKLTFLVVMRETLLNLNVI